MLSSLDSCFFRLVLLLQAGVDDRIAVGHFAPGTRMNHHLLGGLMHRQQLAQVDERLFAGFRARMQAVRRRTCP